MKKQTSFIIVASALLGLLLVSCNPQDNLPEFNVILSSDIQMTIGPGAGTYEITYEIENPTADGAVSASLKEEADWITDLNANRSYGKVVFSVDENIDTLSSRQAVILISYEDWSQEVEVIQEKGATYGTFSIDVGPNGTGEVKWSVIPPDEEITYVSMLTDKATWDSFSSYEEYMQFDIEYFHERAEEFHKSYEEYLKQSVLKKGTVNDITAKGLSPDTEYVVYAYGMDTTGRILTGMFYKITSTEPVAQQDVTFEVAVTQNFPFVTISAVPSDNSVYYLMDIYNGTGTPEEITEAYGLMLEDIIYTVSALGMSISEYMQSVAFIGQASTDPILLGDAMEQTAFAVAVDISTGVLISIASTLEFNLDFGE